MPPLPPFPVPASFLFLGGLLIFTLLPFAFCRLECVFPAPPSPFLLSQFLNDFFAERATPLFFLLRRAGLFVVRVLRSPFIVPLVRFAVSRSPISRRRDTFFSRRPSLPRKDARLFTLVWPPPFFYLFFHLDFAYRRSMYFVFTAKFYSNFIGLSI